MVTEFTSHGSLTWTGDGLTRVSRFHDTHTLNVSHCASNVNLLIIPLQCFHGLWISTNCTTLYTLYTVLWCMLVDHLYWLLYAWTLLCWQHYRLYLKETSNKYIYWILAQLLNTIPMYFFCNKNKYTSVWLVLDINFSLLHIIHSFMGTQNQSIFHLNESYQDEYCAQQNHLVLTRAAHKYIFLLFDMCVHDSW